MDMTYLMIWKRGKDKEQREYEQGVRFNIAKQRRLLIGAVKAR